MAGRIIDQIKAQDRKDPFTRFVESMSEGRAKNTYIKEFKGFSEWMKLTPDDLYQLGVECYTSTDPSEKILLVDKIGEYVEMTMITKLGRGNKTYSYAKGQWIKKAVKKFFSANGIKIEIDRSHKLNRITKARISHFRKPTKEEVALIINTCPNFKLKSAVALSKESGLRVSDLCEIRYKHVKEALTSKDGFSGFVLETDKTELIAMPVYGEEATKYLKLWLPELERILGRPLTDEDYIYPQLKYANRRGEKSDPNTFDRNLNWQIFRALRSHDVAMNGMRYFMESGLEAKLNKNIIMKIEGKVIPDSTKSYSHHDVEELLKIYRPVYDVLRVEGSDNLEEIQGLRQEIIKMQDRILHSERLYKLSEEARNEEKDRANI